MASVERTDGPVHLYKAPITLLSPSLRKNIKECLVATPYEGKTKGTHSGDSWKAQGSRVSYGGEGGLRVMRTAW